MDGIDGRRVAALRRRSLAWFTGARRDLSWLRRRDPFATRISEARLPRPRVDTVVPHRERFLARLPDVSILLALLALAAPSSRAEPSNVLLIVADDLAACLACYDDPVCETPHLDRLAAEGVRFTAAHCQFPLCAPSRASFMSGLYPETTGIVSNDGTLGSYRVVTPELADHPSLGGFFRERGYFTARVSKLFHMGVPGGIERGEPGGDDPDAWDFAFDVMGPETLSPGTRTLLSPGRKHYGSSFAVVRVPDEFADTQTDWLATTQAIAILESRAHAAIPGATNKRKPKPDAPFFLAVGLVRPHVPLVAPERHFARYDPEHLSLPAHPPDDLDDVPAPARVGRNEGNYDMSEAAQREALAAYYASVSFVDEQVGRLLDALDRLGLRDDTVVVFLSDHGWNLGEHGCWQKVGLWREATRVPLIVSAPGYESSAGEACAALVELVDLYPTLAELCGLTDEAPARLQGESLVPLLAEPAKVDPDAVAYTRTRRGARSLRVGRWRYSDWGTAGEELYDLDSDPHEFVNLAGLPEHAATLERLRARLAEKVREIGAR